MGGMKNIYKNKYDVVILAGIIVSAILFRLFLIRYRFAVSFDEVNYLKLGISGAKKGIQYIYHPFWSPLYPFVISLFSKLSSHYEWIGRTISVLSGSIILIPLFYFTKYHFDKKVAFLSISLLAFYPSLAFFHTTILTGPLYALLLTSGIILGWFTLKKRYWQVGIFTGLIFGLTYLTRPEGIGLFIVFIGLLALRIFFQDKKTRFRFLLLSILVSIGLIVTVLPYLLYLHRTTGEWTFSAKGKTLQQGETYALTRSENEEDRFLMLSEDNKSLYVDQMWHSGDFIQSQKNKGESAIKVTPQIFFRKYLKNLYQISSYMVPKILTTVIFIFVILGLFGENWSKQRLRRELYLLTYLFFFFFLVIPVFHVNERYFFPFIPLCYIWVGKGIVYFIDWLKKTFRNAFSKLSESWCQRIAVSMVIIGYLGLVFVPQLVKILSRDPKSREYWAEPIEQKKAGLWIKNIHKGTPVIMSRNHAVDFYAGNYNIVESVTVPQNQIDRVIQYAIYRNVDYIVLNERYLQDYPKLANLLDGVNIPESLKLVYQDDEIKGLKTVIYQVVVHK